MMESGDDRQGDILVPKGAGVPGLPLLTTERLGSQGERVSGMAIRVPPSLSLLALPRRDVSLSIEPLAAHPEPLRAAA
jgi:hypothetical protein